MNGHPFLTESVSLFADTWHLSVRLKHDGDLPPTCPRCQRPQGRDEGQRDLAEADMASYRWLILFGDEIDGVLERAWRPKLRLFQARLCDNGPSVWHKHIMHIMTDMTGLHWEAVQ